MASIEVPFVNQIAWRQDSAARDADALMVLKFAIMWECVYQFSKFMCKRTFSIEKLQMQGASYACAFMNAVVCSVLGIWLSLAMLSHEPLQKAQVRTVYGVYVYQAAQCFLGWLCMDVVHLLTHFPALGGVDTVMHHCGFICLTFLGMGYQVYPFIVAWLLLGEVSSLPLNIRWYLITTGRGDTPAMDMTNYAFGILFLIVRVAVYWSGLYELLVHLRPLLLGPPHNAPSVWMHIIMGFVSAGGLLNAFWVYKIFKMAARSGKKKKAKAEKAE